QGARLTAGQRLAQRTFCRLGRAGQRRQQRRGVGRERGAVLRQRAVRGGQRRRQGLERGGGAACAGVVVGGDGSAELARGLGPRMQQHTQTTERDRARACLGGRRLRGRRVHG